jgi:carbon starvation protein
MPANYLLIVTLCGLALAYRYYSAFLAARVAVIEQTRVTPAHAQRDGKDYHPTNRWILFGHHFAAIAGAGPLVGPVLAAQYGYLPGALWILIGSVFAGGVHDYIILHASVRNRGESISRIAERYLGPVAGWCAAVAVLFVIIVALAGLAAVVVNALSDSAWGVFTIACSIPIALLMGQWMYRLRPGRIAEASVLGVALLLLAVIGGEPVARSAIAGWFHLSKNGLEYALPTYGFVAAVLPVWMLLVPRDYLSTYMKLGTIGLLAVGVLIVNPLLVMPATTQYLRGGGPVIPGPVWPYVCLTIACGAISGFHALIGSGTTPKMISSEADLRPIGYGAMIAEGLVGMLALIAACTLLQDHYFAINVPHWAAGAETVSWLRTTAAQVGETTLAGRTGGAVTLAIGMAGIFGKLPGMAGMMSYWYHFAIMFEALFILTTIDAGTRVARFLLQEMLGHVYRPLSRGTWWPGVIATSFLVTYAWFYLLHGGTVATIWPLFGIANQLLAAIALAIGTSYVLRHAARRVYALTTFLPFSFMIVTVLTAGVEYTGQALRAVPVDYVKPTLTVLMMALAVIICAACANNWRQLLCGTCAPLPEIEQGEDLLELAEGTAVSD